MQIKVYYLSSNVISWHGPLVQTVLQWKNEVHLKHLHTSPGQVKIDTNDKTEIIQRYSNTKRFIGKPVSPRTVNVSGGNQDKQYMYCLYRKIPIIIILLLYNFSASCPFSTTERLTTIKINLVTVNKRKM